MEPSSLAATAVAGSICAYVLVNVETQVRYYTTYARADEIIDANQRLRERGYPHRYIRPNDPLLPSLHNQD